MAFPGEIFLRLAGVVVIPLLTSMLVASIATAGLAAARRVGLLAFAFYVVSKAMAMAVAYALAVSLDPGNPTRRIDVSDVRPIRGRTHYVNIVLDVCRNAVPGNLMEALIFTPYTVVEVNSTGKETNISLEGQTPVIRRNSVPNYVGMTVISVLLGAVLAILGESSRGFIELFVAVNDVMLNLGQLIMWYFPIGICFLLTSQTLRSHEFVTETRQLETYFLSLVLALAIHGMLTLPALLVLFSRTHYRSLFSNIGLTLVTAFGTSSSNMTLTSTVSSLEGKVGLHPTVVRLVAPLGATFNKDGTAIYMAINTVFFAQRSGYHITFFDVLATSAVTLVISSATAAIPGQNETCIVLTTRLLGLSSQSVGVLVLSDWIT
ncbi:excitatory amino acid transporter-like [Dermacentor variabilis]|uniref:excitatory amino acid transporter-like n=1 Tax=Dermacentor variabilis TaxID=34621 RepID=UPI003F5B6A76